MPMTRPSSAPGLPRQTTVSTKRDFSLVPESASLQLAAAALGGLMLGIRSHDRRAAALLRIAGLALVGVAAKPLVERAVRRAGERRRTVGLQSSIEIGRPISDVFTFFKDFENFPRVFGGLRSVVDFQNGLSHWETYSPSGDVIAWKAVVTKYVPNSVIAWESTPDSAVEVRAMMRFISLSADRTRLDFAASSRPTVTTTKDAIRALMGSPPEDRFMRDLDHVRFYLESLADGAPRG
jgi:uncharacterized membrane protein